MFSYIFRIGSKCKQISLKLLTFDNQENFLEAVSHTEAQDGEAGPEDGALW